jgi:hypothetical protein
LPASPAVSRATGRRDVEVKLRVSPAERRQIFARAAASQRSVSAYLRVSALGLDPSVPHVEHRDGRSR